jgi:hypothetical protein
MKRIMNKLFKEYWELTTVRVSRNVIWEGGGFLMGLFIFFIFFLIFNYVRPENEFERSMREIKELEKQHINCNNGL